MYRTCVELCSERGRFLTHTAKVLVTYLEEIDDLEERYQLAMEVLMYDAALECLKLLKDRERVETFINFIPPIKHYEFRKKIEQLLANSVSPPLHLALSNSYSTSCTHSKSSGSNSNLSKQQQQTKFSTRVHYHVFM